MKTTLKFALITSLFGFASVTSYAAEVDCAKLSFSIKEEVAANRSMVLQIVEKSVLANPTCACEIVKAAITTTEADVKLVTAIVEVAATAAPEQMRLIAQCAVAVVPDSLAEVQLVLAKLDPGTGDSSSSGKEVAEKGGMDKGGDVKTAAPQNVLDFPTNNEQVIVGPSPGSNGGNGYFYFIGPYQLLQSGSTPASRNDIPKRP
jgi:hypothetical protein